MNLPKISHKEFLNRIIKIREMMEQDGVDTLFVYGDEYRKENLRYVSNYWPLFERGGLLIGKKIEPILLCAPEGEQVAREMSVWPDIRLIPDFLCATVPDEIEYPLAIYSDFPSLAQDISKAEGAIKTLGIVGIDAMSSLLFNTIQNAFNCKIVDCNYMLQTMRNRKSKDEIACLSKAAEIADKAYKELINTNIIGMSELEAAGIVEGAARKNGAEHIIFNVFASGERTNTIIGRPTQKIIKNGDMIMCALAVQYEGYVATCEIPYAVGEASKETKEVIRILLGALYAGLPYLKPGVPMQQFVIAVKKYFAEQSVSEYDVYPPLHGIGCAEAESPYPNEKTTSPFLTGMTVNTDISLFGLSGGSNRIEEGYVITEEGVRSLSPFVHEYCSQLFEEIQT